MEKQNKNSNSKENNQDKLSGIERALVLQYLMDGNVPVTLTPVEEVKSTSNETIHSLSSQIFPIALKPEHIHVQKNGKIHLENPPQSVVGFAGKTVRVEFYFNRVGLYFSSIVDKDRKGLYILVPETLNRIKDVEEKTDYDFSAVLFFECNSKKDINKTCVPWEKEVLFSRPVWKSIPLENQKKAKELLEQFVAKAKVEKNAGNGIQLIPVCNYLTYEPEQKIQSIENRVMPHDILYVDHERIVLGTTNEQDNYVLRNEYGLKLCFSIKNSPILSRDIFVTCAVNNIYSSADGKRKCIDFIYTTLQEEDLRYLYEKATKRLFV
ncbi:MAG: hypothetical protein K5907_01765 [Treponema sp.]|nr:hypothetical protein [Treponema sp.]